MRKTGFLFDKRYLLHQTGKHHVEVPERLEAIYQGIKDAGLLPMLTIIPASKADRKWVETVHDKALIDRLCTACSAGYEIFESPDNQMCSETFEIALLAVGGVLDAVNMVMEGKIDNVFCAVRPPGHHAEHNRAMGFCYFNNVAIAARYLQIQWSVKKIGIVDFDVHHGNGTQQIFEEDPTVFYYSIHEHPSFAYPGSGREFEQGRNKGFGFTKNSPVLPGQGDAEYTRLVTRDLFPSFERYKPEVILVSTGFDAHIDDRLADMCVTTEWFTWMMNNIIRMADQYARGRVISVLEGGYNLERLPELATNHVKCLLGI
jgi:acetoin utilization deacetylase AcuC-like enzyme